MSYIGRDTDKISNVEVLDNITFDGSSSYTLQKGGSNFTPSSANTLLVSIDGVVQAGNFTVSGSTIDFGTAVAGTSTCDFILHYGVGLITAPSDGTVTEAKIGTNAVTPAKLGYDYNQYRNIIINGDMSIAQRGTSASSIASNGYHSCDRWRYAESSSAVVTISQATDVPTGQGFAKSFKVDCTTADASLGAAEYVLLQQKIEGQNLQYLKKGTSSAESLTLSFWVKSTKTGTFIAMLYDRDNTRQIAKSYTVSSADTWEKKTITFAGDTSGTLDNDNASSLELWLWLGVGSDYSSGTLATSWETETAANQAVGQVNAVDSTSNNFLITGIQLEAGTTASDFEFLPVDVNLQRCQRYFWSPTTGTSGNGSVGVGGFFNTTQGDFLVSFPTAMRGTYSLGYSALSDIRVTSHTAAYDASAIALNASVALTSSVVRITSGTALATAGNYGYFFLKNTSARLKFDAEL
jgi:hypothetical protein